MKKPKPRKGVQYVTRNQLARLRDEIEDVLDRARRQVNMAEDECKVLREAFADTTEEYEAMRREVQNMKIILGLDKTCPPYSPALGEHVAASYFHAWIARISDRIEKLEKKK